MNATRRAAKRVTNQAYEQRRRLAGAVTRSFRLSPAAAKSLASIARAFRCNGSDVINGFLLGNINHEHAALMREHGLSLSEAKAWIQMQQDAELPRYDLTDAGRAAMRGMA